MKIKQIPSPNFFKGHKKRIAIVLHVSGGTLKSMDEWFSDPKSQVSAHYGIGKNGEIHQYVDEKNSAWAVGVVKKPLWKFLQKSINPNLYTISIEHEGFAYTVWTDAMKKSSEKLIEDIAKRNKIIITSDTLIGHYQIDIKKPFIGGKIDAMIARIKEEEKKTPYEMLLSIANTLPPTQAKIVRAVAAIIKAFS